jgi:hypothetical protein
MRNERRDQSGIGRFERRHASGTDRPRARTVEQPARTRSPAPTETAVVAATIAGTAADRQRAEPDDAEDDERWRQPRGGGRAAPGRRRYSATATMKTSSAIVVRPEEATTTSAPSGWRSMTPGRPRPRANRADTSLASSSTPEGRRVATMPAIAARLSRPTTAVDRVAGDVEVVVTVASSAGVTFAFGRRRIGPPVTRRRPGVGVGGGVTSGVGVGPASLGVAVAPAAVRLAGDG